MVSGLPDPIKDTLLTAAAMYNARDHRQADDYADLHFMTKVGIHFSVAALVGNTYRHIMTTYTNYSPDMAESCAVGVLVVNAAVQTSGDTLRKVTENYLYPVARFGVFACGKVISGCASLCQDSYSAIRRKQSVHALQEGLLDEEKADGIKTELVSSHNHPNKPINFSSAN